MFSPNGLTPAWVIFLTILCFHLQSFLVQAAQQYPPNFFNHNGCLYVTTNDAGNYKVAFQDGTEPQSGLLGKLSYDPKSTCANGSEPGLLIMNYETSDNNFERMSIEMKITNDKKNYNWEISSAILKITPINPQYFPDKQITLFPANGGQIYAPSDRSYSCSSLVFTNSNGPIFRITLRRFQLQPFPEPQTSIFAASRDCSSWLTLPQIMGFLLIFFIIFVVLIGAYLLLELGNQSSDLRFSKQGGMLMNQAQLDATKAD